MNDLNCENFYDCMSCSGLGLPTDQVQDSAQEQSTEVDEIEYENYDPVCFRQRFKHNSRKRGTLGLTQPPWLGFH